MNGDTPKKPAEGDWQTDTHDEAPASSQADTATKDTHDEVVISNLRDDAATPDVASSQQVITPSVASPDTNTTAPQDVQQAEQPAMQDLSTQAEPIVPAVDPAPSVAPAAQQSPNWTTTINGESPWDLADAEIAAHEQELAPASPSIEWTASEFINHEKSPMWYLALGGVGLLLLLLAFFVMHDTIAAVAVVLIVVLFGFAAAHKPRTLPYRIDNAGVAIGGKMFMYGQFKSFGIVQEGAFSSITLVPLKRFGQPLSIYYPPEEEDKIVEVLSAYMPMAEVRLDFIDKLLRSIHL